jgi:hypothetical protein
MIFMRNIPEQREARLARAGPLACLRFPAFPLIHHLRRVGEMGQAGKMEKT